MAIKFNLPDKNTDKKRMVASSNAYHSSNQKQQMRYAASQTTNVPITKNAQFAGSAANVTMTQPMFFSPLHTPQNWQIASKRREIYQWSFINPCYITCYDGSVKLISEFYDQAIPTSSYISDIEEKEIKIQDGYGNIANADKASKRWMHKKANSIKVTGSIEPLLVTNDHKCMVIKREDIKCRKSKWNNKLCISEHRSPTCERFKCESYKQKDYSISTIDAREIKKGDFVLIPFNNDVINSMIKTEDEARYAGHLASDGWVCNGNNKSGYKCAGICMTPNERKYIEPVIKSVYEDRGSKLCYMEHNKSDTVLLSRNSSKRVYHFASRLVVGKGCNKQFTDQVTLLSPELQLHVLGAYIQSDGTYNKANKCVEITTYSYNLANQLLMMFYRCGILARGNKQPISRSQGTFETDSVYRYIINISSSECHKIKDYVPGKLNDAVFKDSRDNKRFFWKNFVVSSVVSNNVFDHYGYVYDIRVPLSYTVTANGITVHQSRFYYENEPKVAAGVDFYAQFPMNGFRLESKDKKVLKYFEKLVRDLRLNHWLKMISHEYYLLGDVFPFLEIGCTSCGGSGINEEGEPCNHPGGTIKRIVVLNPDWIEVQQNVVASEPIIALVPDEELRMIVSRRQPRQIYDRLPKKLVEMVSTGQPIPLSNRAVSHLKHNASPYGTYGTSMLRRLFTMLAYKTKLITANWIVAERLIIPVRVVKVGDKDRPANADDIADVSNQLSAVANDPNLTIVTHHAFDYEWYGASGKIHNITNDLDQIGKELLDGLMLNQALLNGEAGAYSSAQVGVETLIRRLENWRNTLAEWVENHIFLPIAMMQGFIDEDETRILGEKSYLYPKIKWNDLNLRDQTNHYQIMMQLHDKQLISSKTLLQEFDLDYDQEIQRIREEAVLAGPQGQLGGAGGMGGLGGMPMGGGGMPPMGGAEGGLGGMPGGEMGGMPGAAPAGGMPGAASNIPSGFKVGRKGKGGKSAQDQLKAPPPKFIKLTQLEQKMYKTLQDLKIPYQLFGQYQIQVPGNERPFMIDFAYPSIGVGVETDGEIWHENVESKARDMERDNKLASVGWRILRFKQSAIEEQMDEIRKVIYQNVVDASREKAKRMKKAGTDEEMVKTASSLTSFEGFSEESLKYQTEILDNDLGVVYTIGT